MVVTTKDENSLRLALFNLAMAVFRSDSLLLEWFPNMFLEKRKTRSILLNPILQVVAAILIPAERLSFSKVIGL